MNKVLLVEDDKKLGESLVKLFNLEGLNTNHVYNLSDLNYVLNSNETYETIVLDRLLEGIDSKSYIQKIKAKWPQTCILILSAINTPLERTEVINMGADDYLGKPFASGELIARMKSLSRRYSFGTSQYITMGNTTIDILRRSITVDQKTETLPSKEFLLLKTFLSPTGKIYSRIELLESIWGLSLQTETNVVEATVTNLRKKLLDIHSDIKIRNSRNSGYWVEA